MTDRERWAALRDDVIERILGRLYGRAAQQALLDVLAEMERLLPFDELIREPA